MAGKEFEFGFKIAAALQGNFKGTFSFASSQIAALAVKASEVNRQMKQLDNAYSKGIISTKSYNNALAALNGRYDSIMAKQAQYTKMQEMQGKMNKYRSSMDEAVGGMMQYAGMATILSAPIKAAIDFESAMSDVKKVVNFDTPQQFKEMNQDILNLSKNIPISAQGIAQIVAAGGQAGIARQDLMAFAESAAKMGVAFDITADQAGEMMAKWRTAFKLGQSDVVALADKINYLGNNTAASAPKISDVVTRIGPLGEIGGIASGEIAALGASMVAAGTESDVAATGIKNLILGMVAGEGATKSQAAAFQKLGFDASDMAKRMQTDAKGAILDVFRAIQSLPKEQQATVLSDLFGNESIGAIAPLLSNLDALQKNFQMVGDQSKYAGSMQSEFDQKSSTTANSIELMKNRLDAAQISIGNGLLPLITPVAEQIADLAGTIGNLAAQFPTATRAVGGGIIGLTALSVVANAGIWIFNGVRAAANGVHLAYMALTGQAKAAAIATRGFAVAQTAAKAASTAGSISLSGMGTVLRQYTSVSRSATVLTRGWAIAQGILNIAMSANPIGVFILAATALIGVGYLVYQNWNTVKTFFIGLWESPIAAILAFIGGPITMLMYTGSLIIANWDAVKAWFTLLWEDPKAAIGQFADYIMSVLGNALNWVENKWNTLKNIFSQPLTVTVRKLFLGEDSEVASNATGGIYSKGAFLTSFAEKSGESAIPHTPNKRNIGLLAKTNAIMGSPLTGGTVNATFAPQITIQGGSADAAQIDRIMSQKMEDFKAMLKDVANQQRRTSYA